MYFKTSIISKDFLYKKNQYNLYNFRHKINIYSVLNLFKWILFSATTNKYFDYNGLIVDSIKI